MSVMASLFRRAALTLVAGAAIAVPMSASAQGLHGLSVRAGGYFPSSSIHNLTDFAAWGVGLEYAVPWKMPSLFNGQAWSTSISADFYYSGRKRGILRYIPVTINQVYTFESQNGHTPYAGFDIGAATFGTTGTIPKQVTVTRLMGGLILGLNFDQHFYVEGRYEWVDKYKVPDMEGFRAMVGYRF